MKTIFIIAGLLLILAGCTPNAQLVTLRGNNVKPAAEGLVLDNDTLTLRYSFYSERGLMSLTLFNKLNVPLYVDWKKSAFIVGKDKMDYWYDVADVNLTGSSYRYYRSSSESLSGTISRDDQVGFIPPKTELVKRQFVVLPGGELPLAGQPTIVQVPPSYAEANPKLINVQKYTYGPDRSPLTFRNFLTLSTQRDFQKEFYIDTNFWASDVQVMPKPQLEGGITNSLTTSGFDLFTHPYQTPDAFYVIMKLPDSPSVR